ncbi:CLOCK-interacting pacemaker isoform X2 [Cottoperca gobio]|uniref:CLOCK-interacting pacemaker isoform X2 n=1 Tax=Cottoperca gobio TaxID=56716 RepID=A0A6J2QSL5_COTGO|nr:CLOCK-interacting pacemaker-like isoform X2 [Cottoperca gobio]
MPKAQPCLSEHSPCAASSKNAKNKSNSMTLMAIRETKDTNDSSGRGSRCSSEKDSGYSDGSDWQQTDVDDQRSNKSQSKGSGHAEPSQPGRTKDLGNPGNPTLMPAGRELPPIYIINNIVLKQLSVGADSEPDMIQKRGQLPQRNGSRETGTSGAAHMILLQQPSLSPATLDLHNPVSQKSNVPRKKIIGTYLPILNSYPRIAPHPSKKPPDKSSNDESLNLSKRECTEPKSDEQQLYEQPKSAILTHGLPCSSSTRDGPSSSSATTVSPSQGSKSGSSLYTSSSILPSRGLHRNNPTSTRNRRFLNTVEILRQSGLLDITLRTKELLRQSNATEQNIAQLRQHTELLCQAASDLGCNLSGITAWEHLHRAMAESGSYPNLEILQNLQFPCHLPSVGQPASLSAGDVNRPLAAESSEEPASRLLTTMLHPNSGEFWQLEAGVGDGAQFALRV